MLKKQAFGVRGVAKTNFAQKLEFCCFEGHFSMFLGALGPIFMTFDALETGLKFDEFSWLP